jgi:hypothetical protein
MSLIQVSSNIATRQGTNVFIGNNTFEYLPTTNKTVDEQKNAQEDNFFVTKAYVQNVAQPVVGAATLTGNNAFTGNNYFYYNTPQCSIVPVSDIDLTNKLYVDTSIQNALATLDASSPNVTQCLGLNSYVGKIIGGTEVSSPQVDGKWYQDPNASISISFKTFIFDKQVIFADLGLPNIQTDYSVYVSNTSFDIPPNYTTNNPSWLAFNGVNCSVKNKSAAGFTVSTLLYAITNANILSLNSLPRIDVNWAISFPPN